MAKKKNKAKRVVDDTFNPSDFDPLGMWGAEPQLDVLKDEPTQDADDL